MNNASAPGPPPSSALTQKAILIVDEDQPFASALADHLHREGAQPSAVRSAEEALEILNQNTFDIVVTDIRLPWMNGYEFCQKLAGEPRHQQTPVLAASVNPFINSVNIALCGNVVDFVRKPCSSGDIIAALQRFFRGESNASIRFLRRRA